MTRRPCPSLREAAARCGALLRDFYDRLPHRVDLVDQIQCLACGCWVGPGRFRVPANVCASCDAAGVIQTRTPGSRP